MPKMTLDRDHCHPCGECRLQERKQDPAKCDLLEQCRSQGHPDQGVPYRIGIAQPCVARGPRRSSQPPAHAGTRRAPPPGDHGQRSTANPGSHESLSQPELGGSEQGPRQEKHRAGDDEIEDDVAAAPDLLPNGM